MASNDSNLDFGFAFNDINFSDRVLRIEIGGDRKVEPTSLADWFSSQRSRTEKQYDELCNVEDDTQVKTMHVSSPILAAKSPFFLKLFSNGMKESEERHATLCIDSSEEVAFMDLLKFMYSNTLSSSTISSLLDVLMLADKFQVPSCMRYRAHLISNLPMTCESASRILDLPSSVLMADGVQPLALADAAEKYLLYKDFTKFEEKLLKLPLAEVEEVLSSNDLQVTSEDAMYDFVLKWTRKHYPVIEERREILTTRLASLIHFKSMTCEKLKEILSCNDFDPDFASKVVFEAIFFKAQSNHLQTIPRFLKRAYEGQPVKVLEFELPRPHCVVYLDLKKEKFDNFLPSHSLCSGRWIGLL